MNALDLERVEEVLHGRVVEAVPLRAASDGSTVFRKKLSRLQFARFMAGHRPCTLAMEPCAGAHYWARELAQQGHRDRLIAPHYVKLFIKRQKNDAADAEVIVEAAQGPTMRFGIAILACENVGSQHLSLRHLATRKRSLDAAAAGFFRSFRVLCG